MKIYTQQIKTNEQDSSSNTIFWHNIQGTHKEFAEFLTTQSLPENIFEIAIEKQRFPEAKSFSSGIILKLPIRTNWNISKSSYILFLIFPEQIITFHHDQIPFFVQLNNQVSQDYDMDEKSISSLVTYIIDAIVEINIHCFTNAKEATEELGNKLDTTATITEKDVIHIRRQASRLLSQFEDQFYALTSLQTQHKKSSLLDKLCFSIKDTTETQGHLVRSLNRLEMRLRDLQQSYQYIMERKTEQKLRLLAILSTIYMPLTLISGIYGMNFINMPELSFKYGYYIILSIMLILTSAQLYFFYHKGWFK